MGMFLNRGNLEFAEVAAQKIYVDKTPIMSFLNECLGTEQRYLCVSRPRRFGKSITANMIGAYYDRKCDSRDIFDGKKLSDIPGWDNNLNKCDTLRIDLADIRSTFVNGNEALDYIEENVVSELSTEFSDVEISKRDGIAGALSKINEKKGNRFVIIIDEWDCLFRDDKNDRDLQKRYIDLLRSLFKGNRAKNFTALAYITGILPIKKYNSESALNNFYEYTMTEPAQLAPYIGFNEDEVRSLCEEYGMDFNLARDWYDGYSFPEARHIYGPNSLVRAMFHKRYANYWSKTVAYNSLAKYITMNFDGLKDAIKLMLGDQRVKVRTGGYQNDMTSFKNKDDVLTVLIHLGYLAYDEEREEVYIPNKEVRQCFEQTLTDTDWTEVLEAIDESEALLEATMDGDADEVAKRIDECHTRNTSILNYNNENALASCISLAYYTARNKYIMIREMPSGRGFADILFLPKPGMDTPAMIVELKWKKDAKTAITQIKEKQYTKALEDYKGDILLVGISYDKDSKKHTCLIETV